MWQFLNQYGWYIFMFGLMFFMHRRGTGGCYDGGNQHESKNHQDQHVTKRPISFEPNK